MTETTTTTDPRPLLTTAIGTARDLIASIRPDQFERPTPCPEFDVRRLVGHMLYALRRIGGVGRGEDTSNYEVTDVPDDALVAAWDEATRDAEAAWADPARLGEMCVLPFATLPGFVAVGIYTSEMTVHGWDLARALGAHVAWNDEVVAFGLAIMKPGLPAEHRGGEVPFQSVVEVAADAPLIDQLVAWNGRRP
jgi:uncharacterized protein (TIGR03086 family)